MLEYMVDVAPDAAAIWIGVGGVASGWALRFGSLGPSSAQPVCLIVAV